MSDRIQLALEKMRFAGCAYLSIQDERALAVIEAADAMLSLIPYRQRYSVQHALAAWADCILGDKS